MSIAKNIANENLQMCKIMARAEAQRSISESDSYYAYDESSKIPIAKGNTMAEVQMAIEGYINDSDLPCCDYYVLRKTCKLVAYHAYLGEERED